MRFISFYQGQTEESGLVLGDNVLPLKSLNSEFNWDLYIKNLGYRIKLQRSCSRFR